MPSIGWPLLTLQSSKNRSNTTSTSLYCKVTRTTFWVMLCNFTFRITALVAFAYLCWLPVLTSIEEYCFKSDTVTVMPQRRLGGADKNSQYCFDASVLCNCLQFGSCHLVDAGITVRILWTVTAASLRCEGTAISLTTIWCTHYPSDEWWRLTLLLYSETV